MYESATPVQTTSAARTVRRRGFTLLELLVVFTIIAVLIGVVLLVGQKITAGSKGRATQNVLQTLDQAMEAYIQAKGGTAARFPDRFVDATKAEFPFADATVGAPGGTLIPSGEFVIELLKSEPASAAIIQKIPSEFVDPITPTAVINGVPQKGTSTGPQPVTYTRVKDAWGKPIRFVHPSFHGIYGVAANPARSITLRDSSGALGTGIQIYREWAAVTGGGDTVFQGDGDGGMCPGGRPYFYSMGADGKPATVEDNVYSVKPVFDAAVKANGQ